MIIDINPCSTCVHNESLPNGNPCWKCIEFQENSDLESDVIISGKFYKKRIITNADRIRSMTDEELAEFMNNGCDVIAPSENCTKAFYECKQCWLDWLRRECGT